MTLLWLHSDGVWLRNMCWIGKRIKRMNWRHFSALTGSRCMCVSQINPFSHPWTRSINASESYCKLEQCAVYFLKRWEYMFACSIHVCSVCKMNVNMTWMQSYTGIEGEHVVIFPNAKRVSPHKPDTWWYLTHANPWHTHSLILAASLRTWSVKKRCNWPISSLGA